MWDCPPSRQEAEKLLCRLSGAGFGCGQGQPSSEPASSPVSSEGATAHLQRPRGATPHPFHSGPSRRSQSPPLSRAPRARPSPRRGRRSGPPPGLPPGLCPRGGRAGRPAEAGVGQRRAGTGLVRGVQLAALRLDQELRRHPAQPEAAGVVAHVAGGGGRGGCGYRLRLRRSGPPPKSDRAVPHQACGRRSSLLHWLQQHPPSPCESPAMTV